MDILEKERIEDLEITTGMDRLGRFNKVFLGEFNLVLIEETKLRKLDGISNKGLFERILACLHIIMDWIGLQYTIETRWYNIMCIL